MLLTLYNLLHRHLHWSPTSGHLHLCCSTCVILSDLVVSKAVVTSSSETVAIFINVSTNKVLGLFQPTDHPTLVIVYTITVLMKYLGPCLVCSHFIQLRFIQQYYLFKEISKIMSITTFWDGTPQHDKALTSRPILCQEMLCFNCSDTFPIWIHIS